MFVSGSIRAADWKIILHCINVHGWVVLIGLDSLIAGYMLAKFIEAAMTRRAYRNAKA